VFTTEYFLTAFLLSNFFGGKMKMVRFARRLKKTMPILFMLLVLGTAFQNCRGTSTSDGGTTEPAPSETPLVVDPCPAGNMGSPEISDLYLEGTSTISPTISFKSGYSNISGNTTSSQKVEVTLLKTNVTPAEVCQQRVSINCNVALDAGATGVIWGTTSRVTIVNSDLECVFSSQNLDVDVPSLTVTNTPNKGTIQIRPKEQTPDTTAQVHVCMQGSATVNIKLRSPYNKDSATKSFKVNFTNSCPEEQKVNSDSEAELQGGFGETVSVSGTRAAALNPGQDSWGLINVGGVRIYNRVGSNWNYASTVIPPTAELQNDIKLTAVLISGDNLFIASNAITVGALANAGRVWWYKRNSTNDTWERQTMIDGSVNNGKFGTSLAFDGSHLFIGEPTLASYGNVYIYTLSGSSATLTATVLGPNTDKSFGSSIAVSGTRLLVGAPGSSTSPGAFFDCSVATISSPNCTKWPLQSGKLGGETIPNSAKLGSSVAINGTTAVVAASEWYSGATAPTDRNGLVAYIKLSATQGTYTNLKVLKGGGSEHLGKSIAIANTSFFVGANKAMTYRGWVDQFSIPADSAAPIRQFRYYGLETDTNDQLGYSLSISNNGSEYYMMVGAPVDYEQSLTNAGSATFFKIISP
jgi:hypothetical protein